MILRVSSSDWQQLLDWAKSAGDAECCGLLRGMDGRVAEVSLIANVAPDPSGNFEINPAALIAVHKDARAGGAPLLGYFHSHPNGLEEPSATDVAQAAADDSFWLIIARRTITAWRPAVMEGHVTGFTPVTLVVEG
jgi:proteasome lid subunit RPN8/RPN11